jgi:hypothetical protein
MDMSGSTGGTAAVASVIGGISSADEEEDLMAVNEWMAEQGLPRGIMAFDFADQDTGRQLAVFDLAWPSGIQEELSQPVVLLLNETSETLGVASQAGFRCFTAIQEFRHYVETEILNGRE